MKAAVASMVLSLTACSAAPDSPPTDDSAIDCKGIGTCTAAVTDLTRAENALQSEFDDAIARLRTCEPLNSTKCYNMDRVEQLVRAEQQRWLPWRNARCDLFAFSMESTSAHGELMAFCRSRLTKERTLELQDIMSTEDSE